MRKIKKNAKRFAKAIISVGLVLMLSLSEIGCGLVVTTIGIDPEYEEDDKSTVPDFSNLRAQDDYYGYANYERLNNLEYDYRDVAVGGFDQEAIDKELIEISDQFSEKQARSYMKKMLPKLDYWKRYEELSDNGEFEAFKQKILL